MRRRRSTTGARAACATPEPRHRLPSGIEQLRLESDPLRRTPNRANDPNERQDHRTTVRAGPRLVARDRRAGHRYRPRQGRERLGSRAQPHRGPRRQRQTRRGRDHRAHQGQQPRRHRVLRKQQGLRKQHRFHGGRRTRDGGGSVPDRAPHRAGRVRRARRSRADGARTARPRSVPPVGDRRRARRFPSRWRPRPRRATTTRASPTPTARPSPGTTATTCTATRTASCRATPAAATA